MKKQQQQKTTQQQPPYTIEKNTCIDNQKNRDN